MSTIAMQKAQLSEIDRLKKIRDRLLKKFQALASAGAIDAGSLPPPSKPGRDVRLQIMLAAMLLNDAVDSIRDEELREWVYLSQSMAAGALLNMDRRVRDFLQRQQAAA